MILNYFFGNVGFWGEGKLEYPEKNLSELRREPTTNSTNICRRHHIGEHSHHIAFPAPPSLYTRLTFFLRRQGHLTADFLLHRSGERQGPAWQLEEHLWPQVAKFFGHWFLHDISSFFVCSSADVNSLEEKRQRKIKVTTNSQMKHGDTFPNTKKNFENKMHSAAFLMNSKVSGNVVKHCPGCLIYLLNQN